MLTRLTTESELIEIGAELFLNNTDRVTKIGDHSVLRSLLAGNAKVARKALKDAALVESHILPQSATGEYLDNVAANHGVSPRFGAAGSSTYVRLVADEGTEYLPNLHIIQASTGQTFTLENTVLIGAAGYTYAKVRSTDTGAATNVAPLALSRVVTAPIGHRYVTNEYQATGGRDAEQDDVLRVRIMEDANKYATTTLGRIEQAFNKVNSDVLRVFYHGLSGRGEVILAIATQNGVDLSTQELEDLRERCSGVFALTDLTPFGSRHYGVMLQNVPYFGIDISLRVKLAANADPKAVLQSMQQRMGKLLDFRFWQADQKVEWDSLLEIAKRTPGVQYVPDTFFVPRVDLRVPVGSLPRIRGFMLLDTEGAPLVTGAAGLNPVFYPAQADFSFQQSVLRTIN